MQGLWRKQKALWQFREGTPASEENQHSERYHCLVSGTWSGFQQLVSLPGTTCSVSKTYSLIQQPSLSSSNLNHSVCFQFFLSPCFTCIFIVRRSLLTPHPNTHNQRESITISSILPCDFTFLLLHLLFCSVCTFT